MSNSSVPSWFRPVPDGYQLRLPPQAYVAFLAAFVVFVFIPGASRVGYRIATSRRLFLDDYFVLLAIICLAPAAAITHTIQPLIYQQIYVGVGWQTIGPDFYAQMLVFEQRILAASALAWTALYAIKFAFLIFFRTLVNRVQRMTMLWWATVVVTAGCALVSIPLGFLVCSHLTSDYMTYCPIETQLANERVYLIATTVMDVVTDILILFVPLMLLWPLQLAPRRKAAIMGMMSLSAFMIVIAIVRCVGAPLPNGVIDTSWLVFWQGMEAAIAVLMISMLVIKSIFTLERERHTNYRRHLDAEKGQSNSGVSTQSTGGHKSKYNSTIRTTETSVQEAEVVSPHWSPEESFALPDKIHCKPTHLKNISWDFQLRPAEQTVQTQVVEMNSVAANR